MCSPRKSNEKFSIFTFYESKQMSLTQDLRWSLGRSIALQLQRQTDLLLCTINCFLQWDHLPNMAIGDLAFYYTLYIYHESNRLFTLHTQQNSYSSSHYMWTVTTWWRPLWRCSHPHCSRGIARGGLGAWAPSQKSSPPWAPQWNDTLYRGLWRATILSLGQAPQLLSLLLHLHFKKSGYALAL